MSRQPHPHDIMSVRVAPDPPPPSVGFLLPDDKPPKKPKELGDYIALWAVVGLIATMLSLCIMGNVALWRWFW